MNEEEIRGKLLLPFLNDLGFDLSEISLEKSFTIKLGRTQHTIHGRSDILCKRNGKNLFVIELKNDALFITQDDIDQAISNARLLMENIAPFAIVSNGKSTKVFDTVTREELEGTEIAKQSSFWKNECKLSTDSELRIRYEALANFVSFSSENLKKFCDAQVRDRMGSIVGNIDNPYAKFVKELYVQREGLHDAFNKFVSSGTSVFGVVGSAGVGKTSAMCSLALQKLEDEFVFFYNAALTNKSPLEHIAQDLNLFFSSRSESDIVLKRLNELGQFLNKNVLIFIDAVDENRDASLALELSDIALAVKDLTNLKICISCKANIWSAILKRKGTPTHLFEELSKSHDVISGLDGCPGFLLEDFSEVETNKIIPLYRKAFGFEGDISEALLENLRNGFFLRIFSEVYSHAQVPDQINDKELIARYLKHSLQKTDLGFESGVSVLSKLGEILVSCKFSQWHAFRDDGLEILGLIEKMNFSLGGTLPEDLFARNILVRSSTDDSYNVSFYYSKIRDYIICYHSFKLDKLSDKAFYTCLEQFYENHIGESAIEFYTENAGGSHRMVLIKFKKDKTLQYVESYDSFIDRNFKSFKSKFDPETEGEIGIYLSNDVLKSNGYALFPLPSGSASKVEHENLNGYKSGILESLFFRKGVKRIHGDMNQLLIANQGKAVREEVFKQLREIVKKGKISVYNSEALLLEQIALILYYYGDKLEYNFKLKDYYFPRFDQLYPIDLTSLKDRIYKFRATEYFKHNKEDGKQIKDSIEDALLNRRSIPKLNIHGDFPPIEELDKIVDILLKRGYSEIKRHHLPYPDITISDIKILFEVERKIKFEQIRIFQFTEANARIYIDNFLRMFENCYKEFVEYCFPTLKHRFPFYSSMPHEYFVYLKDLDALKWGYLGYRTSKAGVVDINFKEHPLGDEPFKRGEATVLHGITLDSFLFNDYLRRMPTIDGINTSRIDEY